MTLALLLTAVTGAWAADTYTITFSANGKNKTYTDVVLPAEYKCEYGSPGEFDKIIQELYEQDGGHAIDNATPTVTGTDAITPGLDGPNNYAMITITAPFTGKATVSGTYAGWSNKSGNSDINYSIEVYFGTPSSDDDIEVKWDPATKTCTFEMPAFDVVLTPEYAPTAKFDTDGDEVLAPKAAVGIIAGTEEAIINEGTVATTKIGDADPIAQGTVMYAVTTSADAAPALSAFSEKVPTAKDYDDAMTLYVWYFIKGLDTPEGETATAVNTFNDSELASVKVDVLTNKFDLTLDPKDKTSLITVTTKAGDAAATTVTPDADGKVKAVKMGREVKINANQGYKFRKVVVKNNEKKLTIGDITLDITGCTTWQQVADKNSTLISASNNMILNASTSKNLKKGDSYVRPDDPVDPTATDYQFVVGVS